MWWRSCVALFSFFMLDPSFCARTTDHVEISETPDTAPDLGLGILEKVCSTADQFSKEAAELDENIEPKLLESARRAKSGQPHRSRIRKFLAPFTKIYRTVRDMFVKVLDSFMKDASEGRLDDLTKVVEDDMQQEQVVSVRGFLRKIWTWIRRFTERGTVKARLTKLLEEVTSVIKARKQNDAPPASLLSLTVAEGFGGRQSVSADMSEFVQESALARPPTKQTQSGAAARKTQSAGGLFGNRASKQESSSRSAGKSKQSQGSGWGSGGLFGNRAAPQKGTSSGRSTGGNSKKGNRPQSTGRLSSGRSGNSAAPQRSKTPGRSASKSSNKNKQAQTSARGSGPFGRAPPQKGKTSKAKSKSQSSDQSLGGSFGGRSSQGVTTQQKSKSSGKSSRGSSSKRKLKQSPSQESQGSGFGGFSKSRAPQGSSGPQRKPKRHANKGATPKYKDSGRSARASVSKGASRNASAPQDFGGSRRYPMQRKATSTIKDEVNDHISKDDPDPTSSGRKLGFGGLFSSRTSHDSSGPQRSSTRHASRGATQEDQDSGRSLRSFFSKFPAPEKSAPQDVEGSLQRVGSTEKGQESMDDEMDDEISEEDTAPTSSDGKEKKGLEFKQKIVDSITLHRYRMLVSCVIVDTIGMSSYAADILANIGEVLDLAWAPIQGVWLRDMFDNSTMIAAVGFFEEVIPYTDLMPTASLAWLFAYNNVRTFGTMRALLQLPDRTMVDVAVNKEQLEEEVEEEVEDKVEEE
eukprot:TRINITY_DN25179_c0_g2_i1.p1 TRINITY_DN25179_c0_g2~~TRINITY_DN25179_c0_g2_i1.p1  ORF type:complete len:748 (-),score=73.42 TRINITY_DN25179_c0_g2_i1:41-2284(-)